MSECSGALASRPTVRLSGSSGCEEGVLTGDANDTLASSDAACVFLRLSDVVKVVSRANMGARCWESALMEYVDLMPDRAGEYALRVEVPGPK